MNEWDMSRLAGWYVWDTLDDSNPLMDSLMRWADLYQGHYSNDFDGPHHGFDDAQAAEDTISQGYKSTRFAIHADDVPMKLLELAARAALGGEAD